jgi:hypothetical protein
LAAFYFIRPCGKSNKPETKINMGGYGSTPSPPTMVLVVAVSYAEISEWSRGAPIFSEPGYAGAAGTLAS